jgi:hypothetical protein
VFSDRAWERHNHTYVSADRRETETKKDPASDFTPLFGSVVSFSFGFGGTYELRLRLSVMAVTTNVTAIQISTIKNASKIICVFSLVPPKRAEHQCNSHASAVNCNGSAGCEGDDNKRRDSER